MDDIITATAVETWSASGLVCAICPGFGVFTGYVQVPETMSASVGFGRPAYSGGPSITYGPDAFRWVGIDTQNPGEYWAPDDLMAHMSTEAMQHANRIRELSSSTNSSHRWTLEELRRTVEKLAETLAKTNSTQG